MKRTGTTDRELMRLINRAAAIARAQHVPQVELNPLEQKIMDLMFVRVDRKKKNEVDINDLFADLLTDETLTADEKDIEKFKLAVDVLLEVRLLKPECHLGVEHSGPKESGLTFSIPAASVKLS